MPRTAASSAESAARPVNGAACSAGSACAHTRSWSRSGAVRRICLLELRVWASSIVRVWACVSGPDTFECVSDGQGPSEFQINVLVQVPSVTFSLPHALHFEKRLGGEGLDVVSGRYGRS